jgi:hypothetical protein
VVVGDDLINKLENHEPVDWRDIQKSSVQIWAYRIDALRIPEFTGHLGVYKWTYDYDDFIGYMAVCFLLRRSVRVSGMQDHYKMVGN